MINNKGLLMIKFFYGIDSLVKKIYVNPDEENIEAMINVLRQRTGIFIDPYGDTKLYPSHQKILIAYLEKFPRKNIELVNFLKESSALDAIVYCVGD